MPYTWSAKDPDEIYEYEHDWADRLLVNGQDVGDAILLANNPDPAKAPRADVIEGDVLITAIVPVPGTDKFQYWVSGGTLKSKITLTVWTAQGRKYQESVILPIKQR
jgi:hypothetical protein